MSRWYWHIARNDELMIDLDCHDGDGRKVTASLERLKGARNEGKLGIKRVLLFPSKSEWHYHLLVTLDRYMDPMRRNDWELRLLDDVYRNLQNRARVQMGVTSSLLITPSDWEYQRMPDHTCECRAHVSMLECPVALRLRPGHVIAHYWGRPAKVSPPLSFGLIDLDR